MKLQFIIAALLLIVGCAAPTTGQGPDVDRNGHLPEAAPRVASVVFYYDRPDCSGGIFSFGLDAKGSHPTTAADQWNTYPVLGVYEGGVYVRVGEECRIGGDYDGYDLFILGPGTPTVSSNMGLNDIVSVGVDVENVAAPAKRQVFTPNILVTDGDSITFGYGLESGESWPELVTAGRPGTTLYNVAVSGATLRERSAAAAADVDVHFNPKLPGIVIVFAGTNDFYFGYTAATTLPVLWAYCEARLAVGWKVYVVTMLPRERAGASERDAYNAGIRANWFHHADGIIDVALDPTIGQAGEQLDTLYYQDDGVHPKATGARIIADRALAVVQ